LLHPSVVVVICLAGMICIAPIAFYLCWIASINRLPRPTVVHGAWDFAGLLAALFGFLLMGGLILISLVQHDPRLFIRSGFQDLHDVFERQWLYWTMMLLGYVLVIGLLAMIGLRQRSRWLSVYNTNSETAEEAIEQALKQAAMPITRRGNSWSDQNKLIEMVPFHGTGHVTIRILVPDSEQKNELERHIRAYFLRSSSPENPAVGWISAFAGGAVLSVVMCVGLMLYILYARF
jgi:hypothetical protein